MKYSAQVLKDSDIPTTTHCASARDKALSYKDSVQEAGCPQQDTASLTLETNRIRGFPKSLQKDPPKILGLYQEYKDTGHIPESLCANNPSCAPTGSWYPYWDAIQAYLLGASKNDIPFADQMMDVLA